MQKALIKRHCFLCYNTGIMSQTGSTKIILVIIFALIILLAGVWYVIGKNRIISAVPQNVKEGEQVILVTPRTPTSEYQPTATSTEEELSVTPTEKPKATIAPTKKDEDPTETPEPTEKEEPTETPTPTPEE
jgi:outer membrane biosynthesis protein TonB